MQVQHIIAIIFFVAGPTLVFYASKAPGSLAVKTILAAGGFLLLTLALYFVGALG
jgi:hypothetical protein